MARSFAIVLCVVLWLSAVSADTRCQWASSILVALNLPKSSNNVLAMLGWMQGEGSPCRNNPLDTTENYSGATNCNSAGVKNYPSMASGVAATVETIRLSYYKEIVHDLAISADAITTAAAIAASPWGTHDAVSATEYCRSHLSECCSHAVV
eukprot:TRINITY_DN22852_c0_g1_i1.p2 TRINITY_DN22852_c0_g1~~TRINITY_DN22852_c0_g1_i1.p2  ORF type:complete len:159 (+),score=29.47 TRINITY_DN22852_c0_g1_i1:22-477(+)